MDSLTELDSYTKRTFNASNSAPDDLGILNISDISFPDDQNWLVASTTKGSVDWLADKQHDEKIFDSRTFTRKRLQRPSILEKFESNETLKTPQFDLSQASATAYFDNILINGTSTIDSFVNMSPPSLVNSMCSSTFTNLMESSVIKNDPLLREISVTDFTGSVLQGENGHMTESCTSINSELLENILGDDPEEPQKLSKTLEQEDFEALIDNKSAEQNQLNNITFTPLNNDTFKRNDGHATFTNKINATITLQKQEHINTTITRNMNDTKTIEKPVENVKRLLDRRPSPSLDLNRLSYIVDNHEGSPLSHNEGNSLGSSDSIDNVDYMSLSSGSSKSSHIGPITTQEKYLQQLMSTPKPNAVVKEFGRCPSTDLSPISGRNSDPELSSSEKSFSPIITNAIRKQKSAGQLNKPQSHPEFRRPLLLEQPQNRNAQSGLRKPSNLNSMGQTLKGSYTSLKPLNPNLPVAPPPLQPVVHTEMPKPDVAQFTKPRIGRPSGLPRPVSRIPAPRSLRPISKTTGH